MPKRMKTPPPPDDEPKYLTVVYPYPAHADMELTEDQRTFVRWLACCIGKDDFLALYYKPSSPNMVIVEVSRAFPNWNGLLGLHKWSEFLRTPTPEEKPRESKVFYCTFSSGREVQKHGWKRIDIMGSWLHNWDPKNDPHIVYPYPATSYCDLPPEDKTNNPLCRRLPTAAFPLPPPPRPPPVGSPEWLAARDREVPLAKAGLAKSAWGKGPPQVQEKKNVKAPVPIRFTSTTAGSAWNRNSLIVNTQGQPSLPPGILTANSGPAPAVVSSPSPSNEVIDWSNVPPALSRGPSGTPSVTASSESGVQSLHRDMKELNIEEIDPEDEDLELPVFNMTQTVEAEVAPVGPKANLWATVKPASKPTVLLCKEHQKVCGLMCRVYQAQKKALQIEEKKKKEALEWKEPSNKKKNDKKFKINIVARGPPPNVEPRALNSPPPVQSPDSSVSASQATSDAASPSPSSPNPISPPTNRPARGRRMNTANTKHPQTPTVSSNGQNGLIARSEAGSSNNGWGHISNTPWDPDPKPSARKAPTSVAASSNGGWGNPSVGPWGNKSTRAPPAKGSPSVVSSNNGGWGKAKGPWDSSSVAEDARTTADEIRVGEDAGSWGGTTQNKSWADQVEDELDHNDSRSVAMSSNGGWGKVSNGPW